MANFDPLLYLVTDDDLAGDRDIARIVDAALRGGATMAQYRNKDVAPDEFIYRARRVAEVVRRHGRVFIINDHWEAVEPTGADGLRVGQDDIALEQARAMLGRGKIVGVSVFDEAEARAAERGGADYIAANGVFYTDTKKMNRPPLGLDGLRAIARAVAIPTVAIGGVNADNAAATIVAGAAGVAVVSAIVAARDPEAAARTIRRALDLGQARRERA